MSKSQEKVDCKNIKGELISANKEDLTFRPSVYGVLIENDSVLLLPQWNGFDFPGGGMNTDETIEQCLKREFWEETGLTIEKQKLITCENSFYYSTESQAFNCILIYFVVKKISGKITTENFDESEKQYAQKAQWIKIKDLKNIKFCNSIDSLGLIEKALSLK